MLRVVAILVAYLLKQRNLLPAVTELNLVTLTIIVDVYHRSQVSAVELFVRRIAIQHNKGMFSNQLFTTGDAGRSRSEPMSYTNQTVNTYPGRRIGQPIDMPSLNVSRGRADFPVRLAVLIVAHFWSPLGTSGSGLPTSSICRDRRDVAIKTGL